MEKIYNLTMNLLALQQGSREPQLELVNPKKLLEECVELIATPANDKGVMVVADVDKDHPAVPLDPDGMHQVIMNLLSNALDAVTPQEGLIRVVCHYEAEHRQTLVEVIDNGSGIPETMMKHMFELFHSTKGNRGTGIGLAVARKIVEEHEGRIGVQSRIGEGTTFTMRLPVEHETLADPSHTHGPCGHASILQFSRPAWGPSNSCDLAPVTPCLLCFEQRKLLRLLLSPSCSMSILRHHLRRVRPPRSATPSDSRSSDSQSSTGCLSGLPPAPPFARLS